VLFVWGFDSGSGSYTPEQIWSLMNGEDGRLGEPGARLAERLLGAGHEVIVLLPNDTTTFLQANAMLVVKALEDIAAGLPPGTTPATIIGLSAGGVISRWALLHMENRGIQFPGMRVVRYFSYDSPHRGANVPLGIQWYLNFLYGAGQYVPVLNAILKQNLDKVNSIAARQLATYHYGGNARPQGNPGPDPLRQHLMAELGGRWPRGVTRYAIANGSGVGRPQPISPGDLIFMVPNINAFRTMPKNWEECQIASVGAEKPAIAWAWIYKGLQPLDSAPGSTGTFYNLLFNALTSFGYDLKLGPPELCFVPTTSALDCDDDVWYGSPSSARGAAARHFADWYFPPHNEAHVKVTNAITEFILSRMAQPLAASA
jgi:hypothetical protein